MNVAVENIRVFGNITDALVQLCTTLQALGAQLVNSVVDCAV